MNPATDGWVMRIAFCKLSSKVRPIAITCTKPSKEERRKKTKKETKADDTLRNNRIINTETTYKMNDRQTDVKHKFQNRSARMLPLSAQQHDNGISATGVPTTLLLSSFKVLQVH